MGIAKIVSRLSVLNRPSLTTPSTKLLRGSKEDGPVLRNFLLVAELLVGVGLELLGLGVVRVGEHEVVQHLDRPPVVVCGRRQQQARRS
jgi:hypothetical protein